MFVLFCSRLRMGIGISAGRTNMFVFLVLMLIMFVLVREWERHGTDRWVRSSSAYACACVAGVLTCLCLCYAYACAYLYALSLVRTSLNMDYMISRIEPWYQRAVHVIYIHYSSPSPVCLPSRYLCYLFQFSSWITLKDSTATNSNFCGCLSTQ